MEELSLFAAKSHPIHENLIYSWLEKFHWSEQPLIFEWPWISGKNGIIRFPRDAESGGYLAFDDAHVFWLDAQVELVAFDSLASSPVGRGGYPTRTAEAWPRGALKSFTALNRQNSIIYASRRRFDGASSYHLYKIAGQNKFSPVK